MVCVVGFEPTASHFQGGVSTGLTYTQIVWYRHLGLNQGPTPYQDAALPLSYDGIKLERISRFELEHLVWKTNVLNR